MEAASFDRVFELRLGEVEVPRLLQAKPLSNPGLRETIEAGVEAFLAMVRRLLVGTVAAKGLLVELAGLGELSLLEERIGLGDFFGEGASAEELLEK